MEHQGEALRVVFSRNKVNITDLANRLKVSRTTVYSWFDMTIIPYENLEKISKEMNMDIFEMIRMELGSKTFKKYNPVVIKSVEEKAIRYGDETVTMQVKLDGRSETLDRLIEKLRILNEALNSFGDAISH